tara:strand:- start:312 stop:542 length:231 start_codon:yes stop_codon:yes gene_type:complete
MINQHHPHVVEIFEESLVDDEIIVVKEDDVVVIEEDNIDDYEWIDCMDCVQRKMICILTILIVGIILLIFVSILGK